MKLLIALLFPLSIFGQCPEHDACDDALVIQTDTIYRFCNYDCNEEDDGNNLTWGIPCASEELGFWLELTITNYDTYTFKYYNDYYVSEDIYGAQIFIYDEGTTCSTMGALNSMLEGFPCVQDANPTDYDVVFTLNLDVGTYLIQVDGYTYATGCGDFSVCSWNPLALSIEDEAKRKEAVSNYILKGFTILGQRK